MGTNTTKLALFKPASTDPVDSVVDLNNNWDKIDAQLPVVICTSTTRPTAGNLYGGQRIYETDTGLFVVYDGSGWKYPTVKAIAPVDSVQAAVFQAHSATQSANILDVFDYDGTTRLFGVSRDGNRVGKTGNQPFAMEGQLVNAVFSGVSAVSFSTTWTSGRFTQSPLVQVTANVAGGSIANSQLRFEVYQISSTGCSISAVAPATLSATIPCAITAMQMTANSGVG